MFSFNYIGGKLGPAVRSGASKLGKSGTPETRLDPLGTMNLGLDLL